SPVFVIGSTAVLVLKTVDRRAADDEDRRPDLRIRLPRGQLRDDRNPPWRARDRRKKPRRTLRSQRKRFLCVLCDLRGFFLCRLTSAVERQPSRQLLVA